jgi:hypothetical protein
MMYLDLAELEHLFQGRALWSVGRPNLAWFRRRDYLGDPQPKRQFTAENAETSEELFDFTV